MDLEQSPSGAWHLSVLGKGSQLAVVPCPAWVAAEVLDTAAEAGIVAGRIWPTAKSETVQSAVRRIADRAGVACTSHQLRHRYGTVVYSLERDLLQTQRMMRHRSPVTTAGYAQVAGDRLDELVERLPGGPAPVGPPTLRVIRGGVD